MVTLPTLKELRDKILNDIQAEYGSNIPSFGKSFLRALANVQAGSLYLYYLAIGGTQRNILPDTADSESLGGTLERYGRIKLGRNPFPATQGQYAVTVTGEIGAVINAQTTFKSDDTSQNPSKLFILDSTVTLTATSQEITIRALEGGTGSSLNTNDTLTATIPIALINQQVSVVFASVEPIDAETIEDYRTKVIQSYRLEPQGGSGADYILWAAEVSGVARVYPYASPSLTAEINLYIEQVRSSSVGGNGTPTIALINAVRDNIELPTVDRPARKPLGVFQINYLPVTVKQIDIEVSGFVGITSETQTSIFNAVFDFLATVRPFVGSVDVLANRNDVFDINRIINLILTVQPGSVFGAIDLKVDSVSVSSFQFLNGDIPNLNTITYV